MSERRRPGLGRGLSALLEDINSPVPDADTSDTPASFRGQMMSLARVLPNPQQPRRRFDPATQAELVDSVRQKGLLQPVLVRPLDGGKFEIVAGERRWRAAQAAQLHDIPVVIRDLSDSEAYELAIIENVQRQDLSPIEEARGYRHLTEAFDHTQASIAEMVGKSRSHVANLMRLLELPELVMDLVDQGRLGMGHARALLGASDPEGLAQRIVEEGLTARDAERLGQEQANRRTAKAAAATPRERDPDIAALERRIGDSTGLSTSLKHSQGKGGQLVLRYTSLAQLDEVIERLTK